VVKFIVDYLCWSNKSQNILGRYFLFYGQALNSDGSIADTKSKLYYHFIQLVPQSKKKLYSNSNASALWFQCQPMSFININNFQKSSALLYKVEVCYTKLTIVFMLTIQSKS